jgi:hypothetical protein
MPHKPVCTMIFALLLLPGLALSQTQTYPGFTEYDGRPASLTLTFAGSSVTGKLSVSPVCDPGAHLTGVDIDLSGKATGSWEDKATTIKGSWTGGDTDPCDASKIIKNSRDYPNNGTFTISMVKTSEGKDAVRLVRMPTGYGYLFEARGLIYSGGGSGGVDLAIVDISVPTGMAPGREAEIEVTFTNKGNGAAGPFSLYGYAFSVENYQYSIRAKPVPVRGLAAGETKTETLTISVPSNAPSGPWDIQVAVDNFNYAGSGDVLEINENNNEKWKRKVSASEGPAKKSGPDLVVSKVSIDPDQKLKPSGNLTFSMELRNMGTAPAKGFYVGFYLSPDPSITINDTYIGYGIVDLGPGESKSGPVTCRIPSNLPPGFYYVGVIADPLEKVAESDETNNTKATDEPVTIS